MTIKLALLLILASGGFAYVVNVKEKFLHSKFYNGEKIYIKILLGFKEIYDDNTVLLPKKCLYGLKQAGMAFFRKPLLQQARLDSSAVLLIYASTTDGKGKDWTL
jgi:hypothetical protein